MVTTHTKTK